jgi:hypothetical protein
VSRPVRTPTPPNAAPVSETGRRNPHSPDTKGRGRPRRITWDTDRFDIKATDLIIETRGAQTYALCTITHKPTGIVVEGHNDEWPGSPDAARREAMYLLRDELEKLEKE